MSNKIAYTTIFSEIDQIVVDEKWKIQNGRHRVLASKCLGHNYIEGTLMNEWVTVGKEET